MLKKYPDLSILYLTILTTAHICLMKYVIDIGQVKSLSWTILHFRYLMNLRLKTFLKAKKSNSLVLRSEYRNPSNRVQQVIRCKTVNNYYNKNFLLETS